MIDNYYMQRQRARKVLANAERDLANFQELEEYSSSRQRHAMVAVCEEYFG